MAMWISLAAIGLLLSFVGFGILAGRVRRGETRGRHLVAVGVGYVSLLAFAMLSAVRPEVATGPVTLAVLLPAFVAIVVLAREHQREATGRSAK